jgi:hypothetical protein
MINQKLLPSFFKEIMTHIPTIAIKTLNWSEVIKEMGPMLWKLGKGSLDSKRLSQLSPYLPQNINFISKAKNNIKSLNTQQRKAYGEAILSLYFAQLNNPEGLCLDLRSKHFMLENDQLLWSPNSSWYQWDEEFRVGVNKIYQGYYFSDNELFLNGLSHLGLTDGLNKEKTQKLQELFFAHFGPGEQDQVKFEVNKFSDSFYELFRFFIDNQMKLHTDFMFLGIYLVTLYLNLQQLDVALNVRKSFMEVHNN